MKMMIILLLALAAFSVRALETDNYISWNMELRDSRQEINQYFSSEIEKVLVSVEGLEKSCKELTFAIAKNFKSIGVKSNPVENYLVEHLRPDQVFPQVFDYVSESIYRNPFLSHLPKFGLSPNIKVNGYYFGTDKLSHFASTGYTYFLIYSAYKERGEEEAFNNAISYGVKDEQSLHGYWASGVFSYADLEANFQGMMFYRRLCGGENSYLQNDFGNWKLVVKPDMADYVSGDWDETWRTSYFVKRNWEKIAPVLKQYCELSQDERIITRRKRYQSSHKKSFSYHRLEELKRIGDIPDPDKQTLKSLCKRTYYKGP